MAEELKQCKKDGMSATAAAKKTGLGRNTVTRFWEQETIDF